MRNVLMQCAVAVVFLLAACTKNDAPAQAAAPAAKPEAAAPAVAAAPAAASGTAVADLPVAIDVPAGAVANDPTGAPGFHSDDGAVSILVQKQAPDAPQDFAAAKKSAEEVMFKKWVKSEKTADGWQLSWVGVGMNMEGKEYDNYVYEVVKKLGDDTWRCSGSVKKPAQVDANLKACGSLRVAAR